ncbi:Pentatricopeptide repeat-containing protein [Acorus gramineus]|uniref:Pentatricopeptide repeat-containing protein n=1 Tax=Acorus gramineus TaxID=55184 RepID=A0AAV9A6F1_ACOGR|nr:Pentatricopeptide repeat-containing protein [Acorus gramineus]
MLSIRFVRGFCAVLDAAAVATIAHNISIWKRKAKSNITIRKISVSTISTLPSPEEDLEPVKPPDQVLSRLKEERDPVRLFRIFKDNACNPRLVENRFAFEDTIARLAGARRFDLVEDLLEHQKSLPQGHSEGFMIRIIMLYGKAGMPGHAIGTFHWMHVFKCERTVKSFNAVLKVLSSTRRFHQIFMLFDEVSTRFGISPDEITFNLVIKAFCEMSCLDSAYLLMMEMEKAGMGPDVFTYTTLISASYKAGRREVGNGLWNLMLLRGCLPNLATFNVRIQYLVNNRMAWHANRLLNKMTRMGIKPDELTYNLIIKGFFIIKDNEMAKRIYLSLQDGGCEPNNKINQTMVHYLSEGGELDLAFRICKESMTKNWFPSIESINKLLRLLMTSSHEESAREIMNLVRRRVPSYSVEGMKALQDIIDGGRKELKSGA